MAKKRKATKKAEPRYVVGAVLLKRSHVQGSRDTVIKTLTKSEARKLIRETKGFYGAYRLVREKL